MLALSDAFDSAMQNYVIPKTSAKVIAHITGVIQTK